MSLKVERLTEADLDVLIHHADTSDPGDDLVAPPCPISWPVSTRAEAQTRVRHHFTWQRKRLLRDPSVNFVKVVDNEKDGDIIAVARWHFYPQGYDYETNRHWEMAPAESVLGEDLGDGKDWATRQSADEVDGESRKYPPTNFNRPLHNHILTTRDSFRPSWIPAGRPAWVLMHLVTRPSQRRRGAAALLIRWGQEQARNIGASAYLEAGAQGAPVYKKYGFVQVGETRKVDLRSFGAAVDEFTLAEGGLFL
jgi:GNAT superfamily N-acetyltransferase